MLTQKEKEKAVRREAYRPVGIILMGLFLLLSADVDAQPTPGTRPFVQKRGDTTPCEPPDLVKIKVPKDFRIVYRRQPLDIERSSAEITVDAGGNFTEVHNHFYPGKGPEKRTVAKRRLTPGSVKKIYAQVLACGFFSLNETYSIGSVHHHSESHWESLDVTANGKKHHVYTTLYPVERFDTIVSVLTSVVQEKKQQTSSGGMK